MSDDEIAELDGDWSNVQPAERAAYAFTRKLTQTPHRITSKDLEQLKAHYSPTQVLEMIITVAGYNSTNRWTDALNIPAEENGNFFRKTGGNVDVSRFTTPTSEKYRTAVSSVAPLPAGATATCQPGWEDRPAPETRAAVEAAWQKAANRTSLVPLPEGAGPNWERLLAVFPRAGASRVAGLKIAEEKGNLSARVKAQIAWAAARTDRAWYALAVARDRLKAQGLSDDEIFALDTDAARLPKAEQVVLEFAHKLTAAPPTITDSDVESLRKFYSDKQVAEIVHHVCNAAFFNRLTEAAQLPLDR